MKNLMERIKKWDLKLNLNFRKEKLRVKELDKIEVIEQQTSIDSYIDQKKI